MTPIFVAGVLKSSAVSATELALAGNECHYSVNYDFTEENQQ